MNRIDHIGYILYNKKGGTMPTIARFYGIAIRMRPMNKEHNPPHIHAIYGNYEASITIKDTTIISGKLPPKAMQLVIEFILKHQDELLTMWDTQNFKTLPPLE